jgi:hypothetical protein
MPLKFQSTGGGTVTLDVPSTSSTVTLTIPANTGNLVIADASGNVNINGPLVVAQNNTTQLNVTGEIAEFAHTSNSYVQIHVRNASSGTAASADIVATADNGTDASNFIDLGINNSTYVDSNWTINGALDGYLYTSNGNLSIGTATSKPLTFFTGGTLAANERMKIDANGIITGTAGNLMLISGTANTTTSGTSHDFTGIPSWAKRITVMLAGVTTPAGAVATVRIGSGGTPVSSGYVGMNSGTSNSGTAVIALNTGFTLNDTGTAAAICVISGLLTLDRITGNTWVASSVMGVNSTTFTTVGGYLVLGAALDIVRLTTTAGSASFTAGSVNILYE